MAALSLFILLCRYVELSAAGYPRASSKSKSYTPISAPGALRWAPLVDAIDVVLGLGGALRSTVRSVGCAAMNGEMMEGAATRNGRLTQAATAPSWPMKAVLASRVGVPSRPRGATVRTPRYSGIVSCGSNWRRIQTRAAQKHTALDNNLLLGTLRMQPAPHRPAGDRPASGRIG